MHTQKVKLIYYTDPLCPKCQIVEPYMKKFLLHYGKYIELDYRMAGRIKCWFSDRQSLFENQNPGLFMYRHWRTLSFEHNINLDGRLWLDHPVSSSYPASIAYYAAKMQLGQSEAINFLKTVKEWLFLYGKNISKPHVLRSIAALHHLDLRQFEYDIAHDAKRMFDEHLNDKLTLGISDQPALVFVHGDEIKIDTYFLSGLQPRDAYQNWVNILGMFTEIDSPNAMQNISLDKLISYQRNGFHTSELSVLSNQDLNQVDQWLNVQQKNGRLTSETFTYSKVWFKSNLTRSVSKAFIEKQYTIIGGGIGGLTMAKLFDAVNANYKILEKKEVAAPAGHGLLILENGYDALDKLGLKQQVIKRSNPINSIKIYAPDGQTINESVLTKCLAISRQDLIEMLSPDDMEQHIQYNVNVDRYDPESSLLHLNNGSTLSSDLFIAADGRYSPCRKSLFPKTKMSPVDEREIVGTVTLAKPLPLPLDQLTKIEDKANGISFGILPLDYNRYIWYLQYTPSQNQPASRHAEEISIFVKNRVKSYPTFVKEMIEATDWSQTHVWVPTEMELLPQFHQKNMVLIGDAAHPLLPLTSQGANAAINDALILFMSLCDKQDETHYENALQGYYDLRKSTINEYIETGKELLRDFHDRTEKQTFMVPLAIKS